MKVYQIQLHFYAFHINNLSMFFQYLKNILSKFSHNFQPESGETLAPCFFCFTSTFS